MFNNKVIIGIGGILFFTVATGFIIIGLQQRQATRPEAQQVDTLLSCPIGGFPSDPTGRCPSGFVPVPVLPTGGGQQSIGTDSIDGGAFGGNDTGPTSSIQISPTPQVLGFCCVPVGLPSPTPTLGEPTPTLRLMVVLQQIVVISQLFLMEVTVLQLARSGLMEHLTLGLSNRLLVLEATSRRSALMRKYLPIQVQEHTTCRLLAAMDNLFVENKSPLQIKSLVYAHHQRPQLQ